MSNLAPVRAIRVIGVVAKDGSVTPSREFVLWLEQQSRVVTGEVSAPALGGVNTDGLLPVAAARGDLSDLSAVAIAAAAAADFAPALGVEQIADLGPVAGGCPEIAGLEPV